MLPLILSLSMTAAPIPAQAPMPPQAPPVRPDPVSPVVKTCPCSGACVCGCNDGKSCTCGNVSTKPRRPAQAPEAPAFRDIPVRWESVPGFRPEMRSRVRSSGNC